jgi:CBS-domain-containing membrane protein
MTTLQLADNIFPVMTLKDTVENTLQLMSDHNTSHLPVVAEDKFLGLISEDDLEDETNGATTLDAYQDSFNTAAINERFHFLKAASVFNLYHSNVIPVVNDSTELTGTISAKALLAEMGNFCGASEFGAMVVLDIERSRFALSEINAIIESDGATIMHMNIAPHPAPGVIQVTIQINKKEIATIIATFERYDYAVSYYSGEELFENELNINYNNLMNYLNV